MVAHHGFELASGVGLVFQPELGLGGASALWMATIVGDAMLASGGAGASRYSRMRAVAAGLAIAGVAAHYVEWPWELRHGAPWLLAAEGFRPSLLPAYNVILLAWAGAATSSAVVDVDAGDRRWVAAGLAALPLFVLSARHHFAWIDRQAATAPAWWNRAMQVLPPGAEG